MTGDIDSERNSVSTLNLLRKILKNDSNYRYFYKDALKTSSAALAFINNFRTIHTETRTYSMQTFSDQEVTRKLEIILRSLGTGISGVVLSEVGLNDIENKMGETNFSDFKYRLEEFISEFNDISIKANDIKIKSPDAVLI